MGSLIYLEKPILPLYLNERGIDVQYSSYLFATLSLFVMLFAPLWGDIGDKRGRKLVLIVSCFGVGVAQIMFGLATSIWMMIASRALQGIFVSGYAVSFMAYFNDNSNEENRSRLISLNLAAIGLGLSLGSLFGGLLSEVMDLESIYMFQGLSLFLAGYVVYLVYPKYTVHIDIKRQYVFNIFNNIKRVYLMGLLPGMFLTMTFSMGVYVIVNFLEFYLSSVNFSVLQIGGYVFGMGIVGVLGNATITHLLLDRFNEFKLLSVTLLIGGVSLLLTALYPVVGLYSFMLLFALMYNKFKPITTQVIHKRAEENQGVALGVRETLIHFGMLIGSVVGGFLIKSPLNIFYFSAIVMFLCAAGFDVLRRLSE